MLRAYSRRGFTAAKLVPVIVAVVLSAVNASFAAQPPKILVIGATAKSSNQIIRQALVRGYEVVGLARQPAAVTLRHERLFVVKGDVFERATLEAAMTGNEVVISMVGPRIEPDKPIGEVSLFTVGTGNILAAMKTKGNTRLLVASSLGVEEEIPTSEPSGDNMRRMWVWNARYLFRDLAAMETLVRESGLEYVIFRPPFLVEEPMQGDLKVSIDKHSPHGRILAYADFAKFVLDQVESEEYLNHVVGLYSDRRLQLGESVDFKKLAEGTSKKCC